MLAINTTLKHLSVKSNSITREGATALASALKINPVLNVLRISCNPVGDEVATALAQSLIAQKALIGRTLWQLSISARRRFEEGGGESNITDAGREALRQAEEETSVELEVSYGGDDESDASSSAEWSIEEEEEV